MVGLESCLRVGIQNDRELPAGSRNKNSAATTYATERYKHCHHCNTTAVRPIGRDLWPRTRIFRNPFHGNALRLATQTTLAHTEFWNH